MTDRYAVGPMLAVIGAVVGCLVGPRLGPGAATTALLGAVVGAGFCGFRAARVGRSTVAAVVVLAAAALSARAHDGVRRSPFAGAVAEAATLTLSGRAIDDADPGRFSASVLIRAGAGAAGFRTVLVRAAGDEATRLARVQAGDAVVVRGRVAPLRDPFDRRARLRHAVARLEGARLLAFAPPEGIRATVEVVRSRVLRGVAGLAPAHRGLLAGFLLGETREVPAAVVADFRASGLSHLLAVSGANVAFVLAVADPFLRRLRLGARTTFALGLVAAFAVMTRGEPSVLRASALAGLSVLAVAAGRPTNRVRLLAYAVAGLLLVDPFLVRSPGFWLSVGASGGIVLWAPTIERRLRGPAPVRTALAVSLAAQLGVAPVLAVAIGSVPAVTPLANLAVAPVAELLGTVGLVLAVGAGYIPVLGPIGRPFVSALLIWVSGVARVGAAVPLTLDRKGTAVVLGGAAVLGLGASVACRRGSRARTRTPTR
ncbi:MAG: ComEC/Rec2 family competence protein [Actinomycetota bacterium]